MDFNISMEILKSGNGGSMRTDRWVNAATMTNRTDRKENSLLTAVRDGFTTRLQLIQNSAFCFTISLRTQSSSNKTKLCQTVGVNRTNAVKMVPSFREIIGGSKLSSFVVIFLDDFET